MIASASSSSGSNTPPLASKQAANTIASSLPRCLAIACSSSRCSVCAPQMKRTEAMPKPNSSIALLRRGDDLRVIGEAEIIVGAEIDRLALALRPGDADPSALRPGQQALALREASGLDLGEGRVDVVEEGVGHSGSRGSGERKHSSAKGALKSSLLALGSPSPAWGKGTRRKCANVRANRPQKSLVQIAEPRAPETGASGQRNPGRLHECYRCPAHRPGVDAV